MPPKPGARATRRPDAPPNDKEYSPTNLFAPDKIGHNAQAVDYCRTFLSIVGGCATGIAGYTGLTGLLCFFLTSLLVSTWVALKAGPSPSPYFPSIRGIFTGGLMGGFGSFVLFWTMAYDIVHIYG
mmetsp:Transcript_3033/g.7570  ORF Transcript_3033/g.7570 Transcript_3033/m.7570 type:complete len:126 (-) Transcript_3033:330-707(-)